MKVRLKKGVRHRPDVFGGVCYVPMRDDFFAANKDVYAAIKALKNEWVNLGKQWEPTYKALAMLGICETTNPVTSEICYSGPSFIGYFPEIPTIAEPLVLNCFCTAHCPLRCVYCHADDLMQDFRSRESDDDLQNVLTTAISIPSIVAVITGGDPITRPQRASQLIEGLAKEKSIVMDTSGVGDIDELLPVLTRHNVHVRVSLDAVSPINDTIRPINPSYISSKATSRHLAIDTIKKCLTSGLGVTVQTVISSRNENHSEWRDLRDYLINIGVRNWVLHIAINGGKARLIENTIKTKQSSTGGILPSPSIYDRLWNFIKQTQDKGLPIDIRCTDTNNTPNSVLLVGSKGDLYTEGYAHNGKVLLYSPESGRPDQARDRWSHIDRFGHAKRYLNWNPWLFESKSLGEICYPVPIPQNNAKSGLQEAFVETELKCKVHDVEKLRLLLESIDYKKKNFVEQRDEYFDTLDGRLSSLDYVIRYRKENASAWMAFKGPRNWSNNNEFSRLEFEFGSRDYDSFIHDIERMNLKKTWFFEKRRTTYEKKESNTFVMIDEIPRMGYFVEIEGPLTQVREIRLLISEAIGSEVRQNYKELYVAFMESQGHLEENIIGAEFDVESSQRE